MEIINGKKVMTGFAISVLALTAGMLSACSDDVNGLMGGGDGTPVEVTASVGLAQQPASTRAADGLNVASGFSLLTSESSDSKVCVKADNGSGNYSSFAYSVSSATQIAAPSPAPTFPGGVNTVNVYGWYPYNNGGNSFTIKSNQSSDANYCLSDLMLAQPTTCKRSGSTVTQTANLQLKHAMSKVKLTITPQTGVTITGVKLLGVKPTTTINTTNSGNIVTAVSLGSASGTGTDVVLLSNGSVSQAKTYCAVFPPQTIASGNFIAVTASAGGSSGTTYYYLNNAKAFAGDTEYPLSLSLGTTNIGQTVQLNNWSSEAAAAGPSVLGGNTELPYYGQTVTATIEGVGTTWAGHCANTDVADVTVSGNQVSIVPKEVGTTTFSVWPTDVGTAFSATVRTVTVIPMPVSSTSGALGYVSITIPNQQYTGSAVVPQDETVTVKLRTGDKKLTRGTDYTMSCTSNTNKGTNSATATLTFKGNYSGTATKQFSIVECAGKELTDYSAISPGDIICSHGHVWSPTTGDLPCKISNGRKEAIVGYVASSGSVDSEWSGKRGLAIAMEDVVDSKANWANQEGIATEGAITDYSTLMSNLKGSNYTKRIGNANMGAFWPSLVVNYYGQNLSDSQLTWFVPTAGQWNLILKGLTGSSTGIQSTSSDTFKAANVNTKIIAAGGTGFKASSYATSTEKEAGRAWAIQFDYGKCSDLNKFVTDLSGDILTDGIYYIRACRVF